MKRIWISLGILVLVLAGTLVHISGVRSVTGSITNRLDRAEAVVEQGDWEQARQLTQEAKEEWESVDTWFAIMLRVGDTDEVTTGFQEVMGFLQYEETAEYDSANGTLVEKVKHLYETERLSWTNLL